MISMAQRASDLPAAEMKDFGFHWMKVGFGDEALNLSNCFYC